MSIATATRAEFTKQFTTSSWWIIGLIAAGAMVLGAGALSATIGVSATQPADLGIPKIDNPGPLIYSLAASNGYLFPLLLGTLMVTSEFRHRLIVPTFLASPRRGEVLTAKLFAGAVMGALYGVVITVVTVGTGAAVLAGFGLPTGLDSIDTWTVIGRSLLALVLWGMIGVGVGSVIRNQVAAIVVVLAFTLLLERLLTAAGMLAPWAGDITRWLPGAATSALAGQDFISAFGAGAAGNPLQWWLGAIVLVAYAVVFAIIGSLTTWRRDVD